MSSLALLLLFAASPDAAAAAPPPAPRAVAVARARIVAPVRVSLLSGGELSSAGEQAGPRLLTHQQARRDGARVVDCY